MEEFNKKDFKHMSMKSFNMLGMIGEGAFGRIVKARYILNNKIYVLKITLRSKYRQYIDSIILSSQLQHPNLMKCYGYF